MRIAQVSFGFGEYSVRLAGALSRHAEVALWLPGRHGAAHLARLAPAVDYREFAVPRLRQPIRQLAVMRRLHRELNAFAPDLVHLQQGYLWLNPFLRWMRRYPIIVTVHDPTPHLGDRPSAKTPQFVADMAFRRADGIIVHNPQMKQRVAERGTAPERIHVVPHPALGDPEVTPPPDPGPNVLFFGRIWPYKGLEYLIRAEPLITAQVPDARFVIAGAGEDLARYRAMMVHPERFELINEYVAQDRVAAIFGAAAVVALPYVDATQSGVIPIAYGFGRPVVATRVGGLPSQVEHGETGLLVAPGDERALAGALIALLQDPELRARLGANARHKARTELSDEAVANATLAVYEAVLAERDAAGQAKKR